MEERFSVSWQTYQKNICNGFSHLQQRGEFVDMTLAADGHHVQVHKAVMSLVSPYIKDLITTTQCAHPVIFLNNVSHETLTSILEYVYTGETLVPKHRLQEFIHAARSLNINGLDMLHTSQLVKDTDTNILEMETVHEDNAEQYNDTNDDNDCQYAAESFQNESDSEIVLQNDNCTDEDISTPCIDEPKLKETDIDDVKSRVQYTVSNQGNLQIILNRFMYFCRYHRKSNDVVWRCIDYYSNAKCNAMLITKNGKIMKRVRPHNHSFHDKRILKCSQNNRIYSMLDAAKLTAEMIKNKVKS